MGVKLFDLGDCFLDFNSVDIGIVIVLHYLPLPASISSDDDEEEKRHDCTCN